MQIHLDALGGVAGDMFAAALLDAFPEHEAGTLASVRAALRPSGQAIGCELVAHNDGILSGRRFAVSAGGAAEGREQGHGGGHAHRHDPHGHHDHGHGHHDHHEHGHHGAGHHGHRPWARIRDDLHRADLAPAVRDHALAIFGHLAQAEARVHGIAVERVAFHEVGAWDSIADIAAAAHLIAAVGASAWSVSALPLGGGRVRTQHGPLPVPAPATTLLLAGFATLDDGVPGERVTPTGAAILRHLCGGAPPARVPRVLVRSGTGFGTRRLPGISNCLRVLAFDEAAPERAAPGGHREIGVIEFEVDDQSGEDLAMGLDALRAYPGVLDAVQMPVFGKKGRMMTHVRVLARAASLEAVLEACFRETTTIGLRHRIVAGVALPRAETVVTAGDRSVRVKTVERPGGRTAKAEADDALAGADHAARARLRREAEALALEGDA